MIWEEMQGMECTEEVLKDLDGAIKLWAIGQDDGSLLSQQMCD